MIKTSTSFRHGAIILVSIDDLYRQSSIDFLLAHILPADDYSSNGRGATVERRHAHLLIPLRVLLRRRQFILPCRR